MQHNPMIGRSHNSHGDLRCGPLGHAGVITAPRLPLQGKCSISMRRWSEGDVVSKWYGSVTTLFGFGALLEAARVLRRDGGKYLVG